eukprot:357649-Chlamydomonas_euryale.AAC.2
MLALVTPGHTRSHVSLADSNAAGSCGRGRRVRTRRKKGENWEGKGCCTSLLYVEHAQNVERIPKRGGAGEGAQEREERGGEGARVDKSGERGGEGEGSSACAPHVLVLSMLSLSTHFMSHLVTLGHTRVGPLWVPAGVSVRCAESAPKRQQWRRRAIAGHPLRHGRNVSVAVAPHLTSDSAHKRTPPPHPTHIHTHTLFTLYYLHWLFRTQ